MDDLSRRLRLGDPAALEEVMDRYAVYTAKIIAVFLNQTLPQEDMEEVLSDVFFNLWTHRENLRGEIKPYLAAITRNAARSRLRQFQPCEGLSEGFSPGSATLPPEEEMEKREEAEAVRAAMERLSPEDRELFFRFYFLDQTTDEIALVTGQNPSTLRSRLRRGRQKLKLILEERGIRHE